MKRNFTADRPNALWVADVTYCSTHSGVVYIAFVVDVFSRYIVGWKASTSMTAPLVIDALNIAAWNRRHQSLEGLVCHNDAGSQGGFNRSSQHLVMMEVFDGSWRQAVAGGADRCQAAVGGGSGVACADAFAGAA